MFAFVRFAFTHRSAMKGGTQEVENSAHQNYRQSYFTHYLAMKNVD